MKARAYLLFSLGLALLAFALVNTAVYTPPPPALPPIIQHFRVVGNPIQRVEP